MLTVVRIVTRTITGESSVQSRKIMTQTVLFAVKSSPQFDREPTFYVLHRTHSMLTFVRIVTRTITCKSSVQSQKIMT